MCLKVTKTNKLNISAEEWGEECVRLLGVDGIESRALLHGDDIICLMYWEEVSSGNFICGLATSKSKMRPIYAREIKLFVKSQFLRYNMKRLETLSADDVVINRWHEFLGFKKLVDGNDYNIWRMTWV